MVITNQETITFKLTLHPTYRDKPPQIKILLDEQSMFDGAVNKLQVIEFSAPLEFESHKLILQRYGKTIDQADQLLEIKTVEIDGIDIQNIIWDSSYFCPEYPEPWASQQRADGIELEASVTGETVLGHNGVWILEFSSPFYKFLINRFR